MPVLDISYKWNHTLCVTFFFSSRTSESKSGNTSILFFWMLFYLLFYTAGSYWLSILYILVYICQSQSPTSSHHHSPRSPPLSGNTSILNTANLSKTSVILLDWIPHPSRWDDTWKCWFDDRFINRVNRTFQGDALLFRIISVARGRNT